MNVFRRKFWKNFFGKIEGIMLPLLEGQIRIGGKLLIGQDGTACKRMVSADKHMWGCHKQKMEFQ